MKKQNLFTVRSFGYESPEMYLVRSSEGVYERNDQAVLERFPFKLVGKDCDGHIEIVAYINTEAIDEGSDISLMLGSCYGATDFDIIDRKTSKIIEQWG